VGGLLLVIVVGAGVGMILLIRSKKCQKRRKEFISEIRKHTNKKIQKNEFEVLPKWAEFIFAFQIFFVCHFYEG
jgi:hypothetical protein